jgi:hypothetical protein
MHQQAGGPLFLLADPTTITSDILAIGKEAVNIQTGGKLGRIADGSIPASKELQKLAMTKPESILHLTQVLLPKITALHKTDAHDLQEMSEKARALLRFGDPSARGAHVMHGARFPTEIYTRGCHWFPRLFA